jgi:hypothetical protein
MLGNNSRNGKEFSESIFSSENLRIGLIGAPHVIGVDPISAPHDVSVDPIRLSHHVGRFVRRWLL